MASVASSCLAHARCAPPAPWRDEFTALGTHVLLLVTMSPPAAARDFFAAARAWLARFEARYSRFRPDSLVARVNAAAGREWVEIDAEMETMLDVCTHVQAWSDGVLDCTMGPLARLWDHRRQTAAPPTAEEVAAARRLVGWSLVQRAPGRVFLPHAGMALDFGGWGKEWAVDALADLARRHGLSSVLIDLGHDLRALGRPEGRAAWQVGLEDPAHPGTHRGQLLVADGLGVASSGDYLRHFRHDGRTYGHIVDLRSGAPVHHAGRQVTVVAPSCFLAGLLATTAFVLGPDAGLELIRRHSGAEAVFTTDRHRLQTLRLWQHYRE